MILFARASFTVTGTHFSPAQAAALGLAFHAHAEPGSVGVRGRYRGQPTPYGVGQLSFEGRRADRVLEELTQMLLGLPNGLDSLRSLGAEEMRLHLDLEFDEQQNFELSDEQLRAISALGVGLSVSVL